MFGARYLLGIALVTAGLVAACGDDPNGGGLGSYTRNGGTTGDGNDDGNSTVPGSQPGQTPGGTAGGPTPVDSAPAPDTEGKKFFVANVHPSLSQSCGTSLRHRWT